MQIVSLHKMSNLFSRKNKKNIISLSSAEFAHSMMLTISLPQMIIIGVYKQRRSPRGGSL